MDNVHDRLINLAKLKVLETLEVGEPWVIKLILSMLGKARGYSDKVEVETVALPPITITRVDGRVST